MSDASFRDFVLEQLTGMHGLACRAMFGGHGLYADEVFFGIIHRGALYFRTDEQSRPEYERRGMRPFMPGPRQSLKAYYEVPAEILEDPESLIEWARRARMAKHT
ncbi:MAG TPA: TfoX/Sxy family protein [Gammaproteobacteria bacterium]